MTKARQGIPHLKDLHDEDILSLIVDNRIHLSSVTEKTDGASFVFHYDENGFGTQSSGSGSEIMREPDDYIRRATRNGKTSIAKSVPAFMRFHEELMNNQAFLDIMKEARLVRGEVFLRDLCTPSIYEDESIIVATSYRNGVIGSNGTFIIHSMLPDNKNVPINDFLDISSCTIKFDHDRIELFQRVIDVKGLNIDTIKRIIEYHLLETTLPKWGSETEGYVVHHPSKTFKVISPRWTDYHKKSKRFEGINVGDNIIRRN